jgi:hypothetical protein
VYTDFLDISKHQCRNQDIIYPLAAQGTITTIQPIDSTLKLTQRMTFMDIDAI